MKDCDLLAFHYAHSISFLLNTITLGRDVSLYQVISLLFNKLSFHIDNITREISYPALFPGGGKKKKVYLLKRLNWRTAENSLAVLYYPLPLARV